MPKTIKPSAFKVAAEARLFRKRLGLTQSEFWRPLGVHQAVGSRYESGRAIPLPIQILLELSYGEDNVATRLLGQLRHPPGAPAPAARRERSAKASSTGLTEE